MADNHASYSHTVTELFEQRVMETPEAVAIHYEGQQLTYNQLNKKARQIAFFLQEKGIEPHDFVALLLDSGIDFIACILGIVKAGGVYLPLDTLAPTHRLKEIIKDASPKIIISSKKNIENHGLTYDFVVEVNRIIEEASHLVSDRSFPLIESTSPLYLMYTSGSTGTPKGVAIPHQAIVNLVTIENSIEIQAKEHVAQFSNLAFDASAYEIWSALLNGAALFIVSEVTRGDYFKLEFFLNEHQIKYLFLPTSYFHQLIKLTPFVLNSVQTITVGGEQISVALLKSFLNFRSQNNLPVTLVNGYGPTEGTAYCSRQIIHERHRLDDQQLASIGLPIRNVKLYILDENMFSVQEGELYVSGVNLSIGYHKSSLTQSKFIVNPFCAEYPYNRLYKTGDKVRLLPSGEYLFLGRMDDQVKIGGFRVHLSEIESRLVQYPGVNLACVDTDTGGGDHRILNAYISGNWDELPASDEIRIFLSQYLPTYMLPFHYYLVDTFPLTRTGKIDKTKLQTIVGTNLSGSKEMLSSESTLDIIQHIWCDLLNCSSLDVHKNIFELGVNSLLITEACFRINTALNCGLKIVHFFSYPTIYKLSSWLTSKAKDGNADIPQKEEIDKSYDIAIVGMSCRFPKADSLQAFWDNLCHGVDGLQRFDAEALTDYGKAHLLWDTSFVPVKGVISDIDQFDAHFFEYNPSDANLADPQQRLFLECVWEAMEHAGIAPGKQEDRIISLFAGMADSSYLHENLFKNSNILSSSTQIEQRIACSTSMLSTQVSYRLNFRGRSLNVNTACSTGLVVVDQACQELLSGDSHIAIAGAVSITVPQINGYYCQKGGIESPDGQCRPFDHKANGTVFSNGAGVVVLKRLSDAIRDNDTIYAVIKGRGVNNDGSEKAGFTAPGYHGQMNCIRDALNHASVIPNQVGYVEAHGTATAMGDVVEINALTGVYREHTQNRQFCVLGSVKSNIGHTDVVAGLAGLIKVALSFHYQKIPPTLHFEKPNPGISLEESPFFVNTSSVDWKKCDLPRYAGISSFGVGGTNVHMILGEAPAEKPDIAEMDRKHLVIVSGKTEKALEENTEKLIEHLSKPEQHRLEDIAYTLQMGREDFSWRKIGIGKTPDEIINSFKQKKSGEYQHVNTSNDVIFMFPGQGMQYPGMTSTLLEFIPDFKNTVRSSANLARQYLDCDLYEIIFNASDERLNQTQHAQPALFILEYALAQFLLSSGIQPGFLVGHSLGEYVAACLAGVFSFEDGIKLVCQRGLLMSGTQAGAMLAVECSLEDFFAFQNLAPVELALHNSLELCVASGEPDAITFLEQYLLENHIGCHRLKVSHAFHSHLMQDIEQSFKVIFETIILSEPKIPVLSNLSGDWLSGKEATDPDYWYRHLRHTVQLCKSFERLAEQKENALFLEIGPGNSLCTFLKSVARKNKKNISTISTLPGRNQRDNDFNHLLLAMGFLWKKGLPLKWLPLYKNRSPKRVPLPTYAFQKQRYWIEPDQKHSEISQEPRLYKQIRSCFPAYINTPVLSYEKINQNNWVVIGDHVGVSQEIVNLLQAYNAHVTIIELCNGYSEINSNHFTINPLSKEDYSRVFNKIKNIFKNAVMVHTSSMNNTLGGNDIFLSDKSIDFQLYQSFLSVLYMVQSCIEEIGNDVPFKCALVTSGSQQVTGDEIIVPVNASLVGFCRVLPEEHPMLQFQLMDIDLKDTHKKTLFYQLIEKCMDENWNLSSPLITYRNGYQWDTSYMAINSQPIKPCFKNEGIYLITGGLGGIALKICEVIAKTVSNPRFVLLSRRPVLPEAEWEKALQDDSHEWYGIIHQLTKLQMLGAKFSFYQADITQSDSVLSVVKDCLSAFGKITGVVHAAGIPGEGLVQLKSSDSAQKVLMPKLHGTYHLAKALQGLSLDFVVLMSSLASLIGEKGQIDYSSANACLDAFALSPLFTSQKVISINWNTWREVGMAAECAKHQAITFFNRGNDISPEQGCQLLLNALQNTYPNLAVSNYPPDKPALVNESLPANQPSILKMVRHELNITDDYRAPENTLEQELVSLWQENLGIDGIGCADDFSDLGGHSLKALALVEKINSQMHCRITVSSIYKAPTILQLAKLIQSDKNEFYETLVPLKITKHKPPYLFLCHPISGMINCFQSLVSQSTLPMSIYGIQDPGIEAGHMLFDSVASMAKHYLAEIRKIQSRGPYYLMGYSFGGSVFYEVANLLRQQGERIGLLAMIESWAQLSDSQSGEQKFKQLLNGFHSMLPKTLSDLSWERMKLLFKHKPTLTNQDMILFKADKLLDVYEDMQHPTNGWSEVNSGHITCHSIKANHETILNSECCLDILRFLNLYIYSNAIKEANETVQ